MNRKEVLFPVENAFRRHRRLDGLWHYAFSSGEGEKRELGFPREKSIPVPGNYVDMLYDEIEREYVGTIWYEKDEYIDKSWLGEQIFLRFDRVAHVFSAYINGIRIASQEDGYMPVVVDVTKYLRYGEMNTIVVKANNEASALTIPQGFTKRDRTGQIMNILEADAPLLGGILGSVHLYTVPSYRITDYYLETTSVTPAEAKIQYSVSVQGNCVATVTLRDREGKVVATGVGGEGTLTVPNPQVWSKDNAYCYTAEIEVSRLGKQCDAYALPFIIRIWDWTDRHIRVGHSTTTIKGRFYPDEQEKLQSPIFAKRFFRETKAKGYNTIVLKAQMPTEQILEMAEREGLLLIGNIPMLPVDEIDRNYYAAIDKSIPVPLFHMARMTSDCKYGSLLGWYLPLPKGLAHVAEEKEQRYVKAFMEQLKGYETLNRVFAFSTSVDAPYIPEDMARGMTFCWVQEEATTASFMGVRARLHRFEDAISYVLKKAPQAKIFLSWAKSHTEKGHVEEMERTLAEYCETYPSVVGYAVNEGK